jgi:hypothetical protein
MYILINLKCLNWYLAVFEPDLPFSDHFAGGTRNCILVTQKAAEGGRLDPSELPDINRQPAPKDGCPLQHSETNELMESGRGRSYRRGWRSRLQDDSALIIFK